MSSLETRKIEPQSGTTVTLGEAGDTVTVPTGVIVKTNTVKDAGGNTLFTSDGAGTLSSVNSAIAGSMIFISSHKRRVHLHHYRLRVGLILLMMSMFFIM